jgi:CRP-like cAMP-binding protein
MVSLQPRLQPVELAQGEVLHEHGRPMPYGYFIESGMIARQAVMANGRAISINLIGPEGFAGFAGITGVGLGALRLIVQVPTQAERIAIDDLKRVAASSHQLHSLLLRSLQLQCFDSAQMAACNAIHEVSHRLSRWILAVQDRVLLAQATPEEPLPLTHELLSEMLGASRSTVSLAAETLKRAGLISYSRGNIHVTNRKGLEKSACECYEVSRALLNEYLTQR